jgi:hypothetical protein
MQIAGLLAGIAKIRQAARVSVCASVCDVSTWFAAS